ncbi:stage II sporulation protein M [Candidatus Woesearchaeota archaeon]|nr:stage II sporulation protein M [Candidatus Woesearchaeota archaeon]
MVLEQFFHKRIVLRHFYFLFLLSALYVFIAFGVQEVFFPGQGLASVLLVTILLLPSLHHLIIVEETIERSGSRHFWSRHHTIVKCYLGGFFGLLAGFLLLGIFEPSSLSYQTMQLQTGHLKPELITQFLQGYSPSFDIALALFSNNLWYLLIGVLISVAYGAGSVFLIAYNASFFAAFILQLFLRWSVAPQLTIVSLSHLLPESAGFILGAIAGATFSRAIVKEQWGSDAFRNVVRNCFLLLLGAIGCLIVAAFIETYVTASVFQALLTY